MRRRGTQAVVIIGALILAGWIAVTNVKHWGDWVVMGVIVVTTFGAALAIYTPRYPTKRRTFVKTTKPPR